MDLANPVSAKIVKILRWIEWVLLFDCVVTNILRSDLDYLPYAHLRIGLCLSTLAAYSLIRLPTSQSLSRKRAYIVAGFSLLILVNVLEVNYSALFALYIIKTCLLLPRKDSIRATVGATTVNFAQFVWRLPINLAETKTMVTEIGIESFLNPQKIVTDSLVGTVTETFFILLLGFVFVAEQRSRYRAEKLTREVEGLATKLERSRIARDIHDSLGHSLTTLDVQLALAQRYSQLETDNTDVPSSPHRLKLEDALRSAQQLTTQCLTEARQSLHTMRDASFCLDEALQTLAEQMRASFKVNLQVNVDWLPQPLSYQLYLIAKEGLTNVQKHAQAERVSLRVLSTSEQLTMTLIDNGCGFDADAPRPGYGLQGIQERAQLLGGQLAIVTSSGQGTALTITVPLQNVTETSPSRLSASSQI